MEPAFFKTSLLFRKWLQKNHKKEPELLVGFYKVNSGKPSMSWSESVDEALAFGWIDTVRKSIDQESYSIRFTHRKPSSIWSAININKAEELIKKGLMQPAGLELFQKRTEERSRIYSFENPLKELAPAYEKKFKSNKKAWNFFTTQTPSYKKLMIHRIMTAKQEVTRIARLDKVIEASKEQKRLG